MRTAIPANKAINYMDVQRCFGERFMFQRASGKIYQRYKINSFELDLLCSLCAYCAMRGLYVVSKHNFFSECTGNSRRKVKMEGYLLGLRLKGFVGSYEWIGKKNSLSIGVSQLGWKVLQDFYRILQELRTRKEYKKVINEVIPSVGDIPRHYVVKPAA